MPIRTRTFRVFVSSTFEDLKQERDALQREVFPALRRLSEQHGARFQAVDLRWGVRDEAALDQKTLEICLREIERCQRTGIKPNFVVLLGQRYGWRPLPARIEAGEFELVRAHIADSDDLRLVNDWYLLDENAVPAEYLLRPRIGPFEAADSWQPVESRLHSALLHAARAASLSPSALIKYHASATHQEILKGVGRGPEDRRHVFAFCRRVPDEACDPDLAALRSFLHACLPAGNVLSYDPGDTTVLCRAVTEALRAVIESEAAAWKSRPALELEVEAHDAFARERADVFGREEALEAIAGYLRSNDSRPPLVLCGPSGSGKSAVMAQASERARADSPGAVLIRRFIGATPESAAGLTLLRSICEELRDSYKHDEWRLKCDQTSPESLLEMEGLISVFRRRLDIAAGHKHPVLLFLDALEQLGRDDPAASLAWLGGDLPPFCRIVVSSTELDAALARCEFLDLAPLPGTDAEAALDHWLQGAGRFLQEPQKKHVLAMFSGCRLPLYLRLAFEEARHWRSYQPLAECRLGRRYRHFARPPFRTPQSRPHDGRPQSRVSGCGPLRPHRG